MSTVEAKVLKLGESLGYILWPADSPIPKNIDDRTLHEGEFKVFFGLHRDQEPDAVYKYSPAKKVWTLVED